MRKQQQDEMFMRKHQELMCQQKEFLKQQSRYQKHLPPDHKPDMKPELDKDLKPNMYPGYAGKHEHPVTTVPGGVKQEVGTASFSLYGYQPEKYSFISTDQLHSYEQDKIKGEKGMMVDSKLVRSQSPRKKDIGPPPLIKDMDPKSHSSVIVKNNRDGIMKSSSPHGSHYSSHMSPHQQPKPAHTPERPHSSNSSPGAARGMSPAVAHQQQPQMPVMRVEAHQAATRSQSPLPIATPQQLSAAVMQPMDYWCGPNTNKNRGSPGSSTSPHGPGGTSPKLPQSLPHSSVTYTYGLVQQGVTPSPIYSNNSKNPDSQRTVSVTGTAQVPRAAQSPPNYNQQMQQQSAIGAKRKVQKEPNNRKRQKGNEPQSTGSNSPLNLSVPCTTPQIVTNQSPYTTSSGTVPSTAMCTTQSNTPTSVAYSQAVVNNRLASFTGFMDSFKSFVENTVQNAFMSDPDLGKSKDGQGKKPTPEQLKELQQQQQQQQIQQQLSVKTGPYKPKTSLERSCTPVASNQSISQPTEEASNMSNSGSNSAMTYVDSINRVANGQIDTDSDTLSAPSPPPHLKQENNNNPSPHKTAKHPNLKKAWLQRHSDEDKQECKTNSAPTLPVSTSPVVADSGNAVNPNGVAASGEQDKEQMKTCYVNCSYISPSSAGGSKSPISVITNVVPNGTAEKENDESTTSASETETQVGLFLPI